MSVKFLADAHVQTFGLADVESKLLMTAEVVMVQTSAPRKHVSVCLSESMCGIDELFKHQL